MTEYGSLHDTIALAIDEALANVHTTTIAKIVAVNEKTIDVKCVFKRTIKKTGFLGVFQKDQEIELPIFQSVPIITMIGGASSIQMPLAIGDYCVLFLTERCFDGWWKGRDNTIPPQYRMHDYSDGLAFVGIHNEAGGLVIPTLTTIEGDTWHNGKQTEIGDLARTGNSVVVGDRTETGEYNYIGKIIVTDDVIIRGISFVDHIHPGDSGGDTGKPKN